MAGELIRADHESAATTREEFGARQLQTQAETSMMAVAARERANVEARYIMAERHPRSWDNVRVRMLSHCDRPLFATAARYAKPIGGDKKARGFTIRFAETLAQEMRNVAPEAAVTYEDDRLRILRVTVTDLEANLPWSQEVAIAKAVERKGRRVGAGWEPPEGRDVISSRVNSSGDVTFLVYATEDEVLVKQNSAISKIQRNALLKLCPRDILEECEARVLSTSLKADKSDPLAAKKNLIDSFASLGTLPKELETYLGHSLERLQPAELQDLRELYAAIRDGQTTLQEATRLRHAPPADPENETVAEHDARLTSQMAEQLAARQANEQRIEEAKAALAVIDAVNEAKKVSQRTELTEEEMARQVAAQDAKQQEAPAGEQGTLLPETAPAPRRSAFARSTTSRRSE